MEIVRGDNRDKSGINGDFLCIKGRYAFDFANNRSLQQPLIKRDGKFAAATWEQAFDLIATKFQEVLTTDGPASIGVIGSIAQQRETICFRVCALVLGTNNIDHHRRRLSRFASALAGKQNTTASMRDVFSAPAILLIGNDPPSSIPCWRGRFAAMFGCIVPSCTWRIRLPSSCTGRRRRLRRWRPVLKQLVQFLAGTTPQRTWLSPNNSRAKL